MKQATSNKYQVSSKNELTERFLTFSKDIVTTVRQVQIDYISRPVVTQLIRSATSIGANYSEAQNASSRKDFRNKIYIAKKEAQETKYWLQMLEACLVKRSESITTLTKECHEIVLILQSIAKKLEMVEDD